MQFSTRNVHGYSVVSVHGSIDFFTLPSLQRAVAALLDDGSEHIVFDLSKVDFLDRSGLSVLVGTATQQRYSQRGFSVVGAAGAVRGTLERSEADLPSFDALEEIAA
ncbi:MAG: STAS domain-containing protein [Nannocystaceae bacterium]|nr:STAS domain-containing protein [Nannocystaceae bacterium]